MATRGRKPDPNRLEFKTVGLRREDWQWLELWAISRDTNPTQQLNELIELARKFWPGGPDPATQPRDRKGRFCKR